MKTITMQDIPERKVPQATFYLQNENVRFELIPDSYSINSTTGYYYIFFEFLNKDIRECFKPYLNQKFSIHEISEAGEFFYQNLRMSDPHFSVDTNLGGTVYAHSTITFIEERSRVNT